MNTYNLLFAIVSLICLFCAVMAAVSAICGDYLNAFTYGTCSLMSIPWVVLFDPIYDYVD